jgi:RadC-like JAB domain
VAATTYSTYSLMRALNCGSGRNSRELAETGRGTLNGALAHPREVSKPIIAFSAFTIITVHNHPSGAMPYPVLCRTERRVLSGRAPSMQHKRLFPSQAFEEGQQLIVWSVSAWFAAHRSRFCQDFLLHCEVCIRIDLSRVEGFVSKPDGSGRRRPATAQSLQRTAGAGMI